MLKRSFASKDRVGKAPKPPKRSFTGSQLKQKLQESLDAPPVLGPHASPSSAIITMIVGKDQRVFAAHEEVLRRAPYFERECRELFFSPNKRIDLSEEDPETFSLVLEYLYRGDYSPRLLQGRRGAFIDGSDTGDAASPRSARSTFFHKKDTSARTQHATITHSQSGETILRDTAVYCAALAYDLPDLQRLALRKQGLQTGIDVGTILRSMRFAYKHTPDSDSRLRAHFLALIVRARRTFKRSGTMQAEMAKGGAMFFDLFVALCNHLDDLSDASTTPKTV